MRFRHLVLLLGVWVALLPTLAAQPAAENGYEFNQRGVAAAESGELDKAVLLLEQAYELVPKEHTVRTNLVTVRTRRARERITASRLLDAEADCRRALELQQDEPSALAMLIEILRKRGDVFAARRLLPELGSPNSKDARVLAAHAQLAYDEDHLDEAVAAGDAALGAVDSAKLIDQAGLLRLLERWRAEANAERGFLSEAGAGFAVKYPNEAQRGRAREVLDAAVSVAHMLDGAFGARPQRGLVIVLLPPEAFRRTAGVQEWSGGIFDGRVRIPLERRADEDAELRRTLRHEMVHWFVRALAPTCPLWLNEGLAQHFETDTCSGSMKRSDATRPLRDAPTDWGAVKDRKEVERLYSHAQHFTCWLIQKHGLGAVRAIFAALRDEPAFPAAFRKSFGLSLSDAEDAFVASLR